MSQTRRGVESVEQPCRVYWGSHGCQFERGHDGPHACDCCECDDHERDHDHGDWLCVAAPPYYGPSTCFYGEDVKPTDGESPSHPDTEPVDNS